MLNLTKYRLRADRSDLDAQRTGTSGQWSVVALEEGAAHAVIAGVARPGPHGQRPS